MNAAITRCSRYRVYTAALADHERRHVPWRARLHIRGCRGCRGELAAQAAVALRLRELMAVREARRTTRTRRGFAAVLMAGGVAAACAAFFAAGAIRTQHDPVRAALTAAMGPPNVRTEDAAAIDRWCDSNGGNAPPTVVLPTLHLEGARMDSDLGAMMVTVRYRDSAGRPVAVTWIATPKAAALSTPANTAARELDGRTVVVIAEGAQEVAVVSGRVPPADLSRTAAVIAARL